MTYGVKNPSSVGDKQTKMEGKPEDRSTVLARLDVPIISLSLNLAVPPANAQLCLSWKHLKSELFRMQRRKSQAW